MPAHVVSRGKSLATFAVLLAAASTTCMQSVCCPCTANNHPAAAAPAWRLNLSVLTSAAFQSPKASSFKEAEEKGCRYSEKNNL